MNLKELLAKQEKMIEEAKASGVPLASEQLREFDAMSAAIEVLGGVPAERPVQTPKSATEPTVNAEKAAEAERTRIRRITAMCRQFDVPDKDLDGYIDKGLSEDEVRKLIMDHLYATNGPTGSRMQAGDGVQTDELDKFRAAASDGLLLRAGIKHLGDKDLAPGAEEFRGATLRSLAIDTMERGGTDVRQYRHATTEQVYHELTRSYLTPTAGFSLVLDMTVGKSIVAGYDEAPTAYQKIVRTGTLPDFKIHDHNFLSGPSGMLIEIPENGEFTETTWEYEGLPTRRLKTYGRSFSLSLQTFVNDDIGIVTELPRKMSQAAQKTINQQVFETLLDNAPLTDGFPIFSKEHANLLQNGTGVTQNAVQSMLIAMKNQKDAFGQNIIIRPKILLVPEGMQYDMYTLFRSQQYPTADNDRAVNPLYGLDSQLEVVADATINTLCDGKPAPWFLFADPADATLIELDYMDGDGRLQSDMTVDTAKLGYKWRYWQHWGVNVQDFRGAIMNKGTVLELKEKLAE